MTAIKSNEELIQVIEKTLLEYTGCKIKLGVQRDKGIHPNIEGISEVKFCNWFINDPGVAAFATLEDYLFDLNIGNNFGSDPYYCTIAKAIAKKFDVETFAHEIVGDRKYFGFVNVFRLMHYKQEPLVGEEIVAKVRSPLEAVREYHRIRSEKGRELLNDCIMYKDSISRTKSIKTAFDMKLSSFVDR